LKTSTESTHRWLRIAVVALIYASLLAGGHWGSRWLMDFFGEDFGTAVQSHEFHLMIAGIMLFAVLMAIPFVPGIEISLALLAVFGSKVAMTIYAATLAPWPFPTSLAKCCPSV